MKQIYLVSLLLLLTVIYALCFTAIKTALQFLPPLLFGGLRALFGGITLLVIVPFLKQSIFPTDDEWKWIGIIGITTSITFFGMFLSPGRTAAGIASILGNLSPLFTVLLAAGFLHEKLSRKAMLALFFGVVGIFFISYPDVFGKSSYGFVGIILALCASGGSAASNIVVKLMRSTHTIIRISAWQLILGSIPLLLTSFLTEQDKILLWNSTSVGVLLFLSIVGTAFTTATWFLLIRNRNVGKLSLVLFLIPIIGFGISSLVFKESLLANEKLGIIVLFITILLLIFDSFKSQSPAI